MYRINIYICTYHLKYLCLCLCRSWGLTSQEEGDDGEDEEAVGGVTGSDWYITMFVACTFSILFCLHAYIYIITYHIMTISYHDYIIS